MKKHIIPSILALAALSFSACDKVELPNSGTTTVVTPPEEDVVQRVLLEDYTGQGCGNCPGAAITARNIEASTLGPQVIVLTVHAGWFADTTNTGGNPYSSSLSTPMGEAFNDEWTIDAVGNPQGMVNRTEYQGGVLLNKDNWASAVAELTDDDPVMGLNIDVTNNSGSLAIDVNYEALADLTGNYSLTVLVTETDIYDWQKNYANTGDPQYAVGDVSDYKHEHVLRDNISPIWGDAIATGSMSTGTTGTMNYNYTLDGSWDVSKVGIIAYIANSDTKEIIQVYETHP